MKINIGDEIQILEPYFFIRCGYDNDFEKCYNDISKEEENKIHKFYQSLFGECDFYDPDFLKFLDQTRKNIAYLRVKNNIRGGKQRKIFEEYKPELKDLKFRVVSIKRCKTGTYHSSSGGYDYEGSYDYDPAYLSNKKTHIILELDNGLKIDKKNVVVTNQINKEKGKTLMEILT